MGEDTTVATLAHWGIEAAPRRDAPGVYVAGEKIASLGLRVRRGCSFHGLAFNVDMDLEPYSRINPCGFENLAVTDVKSLGGPDRFETVAQDTCQHILELLPS